MGLRNVAASRDVGAANFDKDCAHDAMLVPRSKQAIRLPSRAEIHVQLTVWIISQKIGAWPELRRKKIQGSVRDLHSLLQ